MKKFGIGFTSLVSTRTQDSKERLSAQVARYQEGSSAVACHREACDSRRVPSEQRRDGYDWAAALRLDGEEKRKVQRQHWTNPRRRTSRAQRTTPGMRGA